MKKAKEHYMLNYKSFLFFTAITLFTD